MSEVHPITFRLKVFNAWRRGNDAPQPDPKTVGEDIDSICDLAHRLERERDELKEQLDAAMMLIRMHQRRETWPHDANPFTSPDHDNDSRNYQ